MARSDLKRRMDESRVANPLPSKSEVGWKTEEMVGETLRQRPPPSLPRRLPLAMHVLTGPWVAGGEAFGL
jgi:hypothetical protein